MATQGHRKLRKDAGSSRGEGPKHNHVFRDFGGINTQAAPQAIKRNEFSWIENIMPIGHGNAKIIPAPSDSIATVPSGLCYYMQDYNIDGVNYMFMATDDGNAYQVLLDSPYTVTTIGASFSNSGLQIAQWKNERILIVDPTLGYYTWDGTLLQSPGDVVAVTVTAGGSYTAIPTISFTGGGGAGAAAYASMQLAGAQTVTAGGTGYVVGDIITLTGGTYVTPGKLMVSTIGGGGAVTAVTIHDAGEYTVLPVAPVATTGGGANNCTITPAYGVLSVTVTNGGTTPYAAAPNVVFSSGAATATATILDVIPNPQHIATFSGCVWISSGRTIINSVPDSYYDFSGTGSGLTIITDSTLHSDITQLYSANNFLYFTGVDSINAIGNVQVNSLGDTVFSNTNLSPSIGTDDTESIVSYYRSLWLVNKSGVYAVSGATPQKVSDVLDGIFQRVDFDYPVSSGTVFLQNILCSCFLLRYVDPLTSVSRPVIVIFFNNKWFIASQGDDITIIASGQNAGITGLYATNGTDLYRLFDDESTPVDWLMSSAFWDMDDVTKDKQITKFGFECTIPETEGTITFTILALSSTPPYTSTQVYDVPVSSAVEWINNFEEIVLWTNNSGAVVNWLGSGYFMNMQDGTEFGKYIAVSMSSSDVTGSINSEMLEYEYRVQW